MQQFRLHLIEFFLSEYNICELGGFTGNPSDPQWFFINKIKENGRYPIVIEAEGVGKLYGAGDFSGNGKDAVFIFSGEKVRIPPGKSTIFLM